jgi:chemotaxis signal transduction protein
MQVLFTSVRGQRLALDCADVVEVLPVVAHRPAGTGPRWLLGLFNLRGALVPLVDLSLILDERAEPLRRGSRIVVLRLGGAFSEGGLFGGAGDPTRALVGLLVPEISGPFTRDFSARGAHEGFTFAGASHLGPTIVDEGEGAAPPVDGAPQLVQLLRCRRLLEGDAALRELPRSAGEWTE